MYLLNKHGGIVRIADQAQIPKDPKNRDYQAYQAWLSAGNAPVSLYSLAEAKQDRAEALRKRVANAITGGITHAGRHYPTASTDQLNLSGLVTFAQINGDAGAPYQLWCADSNGDWQRRDHTLSELLGVGMAVAGHVIKIQNRYAELLTEIYSAADFTELDALSDELDAV